MQRLADSSPKVIERIPNLAIGKTVGSNDLRRIKAIIPKRKRENVDFDNQHVFMLYFNGYLKGKQLTKFKGSKLDDYEIWIQKQGFWRRKTTYEIVNITKHLRQAEKLSQPQPNSIQDQESEEDNELEEEEDVILLDEDSED